MIYNNSMCAICNNKNDFGYCNSTACVLGGSKTIEFGTDLAEPLNYELPNEITINGIKYIKAEATEKL